jgi:prevent-host-death family protein
MVKINPIKMPTEAFQMNQREIITISKFKATCLSVLDNVKRTGKSVLVTKHGKPIALIDPPPLPEKKPSWLGSYRNKGKICGDIISPVVSEKDWDVLNE